MYSYTYYLHKHTYCYYKLLKSYCWIKLKWNKGISVWRTLLVHLRHVYCMLIHFIHGYYCIYRLWQPLTYLCFPYCISLIYYSFTNIRMFLYARIYWLAEFGDVSCLQFNHLRVETLTLTWDTLTLTPTWEGFVGQF